MSEPGAALPASLVVKEEEVDDDDTLAVSISIKRGAGKSPKSKMETSAKKMGIKKEKTEGKMSNAKPSSKVKKEEPADSSEEDEDDFKPIKGKKQKDQKPNQKQSKVKKEELADSEDEDVDKKTSGKKKRKAEFPKKNVKVVEKTRVQASKVKKMYELPGQKHDPPEERDPLRIFYESLYQQMPSSEMAALWMMEWGLLPEADAKKVYEKFKNHKESKLGTPVKAVSIKKKTKVSVKQELAAVTASMTKKKIASHISAKKRKAKSSDTEDKDGDDDFVLSKKKQKV